jgi:hypothetical protein
MVLRRLSGRTENTAPVLTLITQFGGGKTHTLAMLYHLVSNGEAAMSYSGVADLVRESAWRCISCLARLMRAGMTRVEAYSSKLLRNVPRWRRSKASTAPSGCETGKRAIDHRARDASRRGFARHGGQEALKSPPKPPTASCGTSRALFGHLVGVGLDT